MAKFETVYDPEKDKIISRQEAIKSNKTLNPYFRCPVCKTKESTLTIFHRDGDTFFRLLPDGKHTDPDCSYKVKKEKLRKMVKKQRDYLDVNEDSCIYELKKKMLGNQNSKLTLPRSKNIPSAPKSSSTRPTTSVSQTVTVSRPHMFKLTQQNIAKVRSILETGEFDQLKDKKSKKLPVCLYNKILLKIGSKNKLFYNYDVYDHQHNFLFSLGISVYQKELINKIESHLNQLAKFYGILEFYIRSGFLDATVYNADLFFV